MPVMLDTNVWMYALGVTTGKIAESSEYWNLGRASQDLVESLDSIAVSAINWFEIHRTIRDAEAIGVASLRNRVVILPVDAPAAEHAAKICAKARASGKICQKCFAPLRKVHCSTCENSRSPSQYANDIIMVASADLATDVRVLYSFDGGVLALGEFVKNVELKEPPSPRAKQIALSVVPDMSEVGGRRKK